MHHGDYIQHELAGRQELSGPDVILIHRLLKYAIVEKSGILSYAACTDAAVMAMDLPGYFDEARVHSETTDDFGEVGTRIIDLGESWVRHDAEQEIVLADDTVRWIDDISHDYSHPPELLCYYLTNAEERPRFVEGIQGLTRHDSKDGRQTAGTIDHCAHGKDILVFTIVDARPLRHVTQDLAMPMGAQMRFSIIFEPLPRGVRVTVRYDRPRAGNALVQTLIRLLA